MQSKKSSAILALTLILVNGAWAQGAEKVLHSFAGGTGALPWSYLVLDRAGDLYGTTELGGDNSCNPPNGCGSVFKLTPSNGIWKAALLHSFAGGSDGGGPGGLTACTQNRIVGLVPHLRRSLIFLGANSFRSLPHVANLPEHQGDAKAQKAHRAAPPHCGVMSRDLKSEKAAQTAQHEEYR
jgi:uncharacterized repeat protein (TIGR03803 family)